MKPLTHSLLAKIIVIFLLVFIVVGILGSALALAFAYAGNLYENYDSFYETEMCESITQRYATELIFNYEQVPDLMSDEFFQQYYAEENCNFGFILRDESGNILAQNFTPAHIGRTIQLEQDGRKITCLVADPITAKDSYYLTYKLFNLVYPMRYTLFFILGISLVLFFAGIVFLCCGAGHRGQTNEIFLNHQDKVPLDLYLCGMVLLIGWIISFAFDLSYSIYDPILELFLFLVLFVPVVFLLCLAVFLTCVTRWKAGHFWRNTLFYRICAIFWAAVRFLTTALGKAVRAVAMLWRTLLILAVFECFNLVFAINLPYGTTAFWWLLLQGAAVIAVCLAVLQMRQLREAGRNLAQGNFDTKVNTQKMYWDFKVHGEHLNSIGNGMAIAVEQKMRSERLKTELITNVSHDIKTPLTSIINYVDLLQKEHTKEQEKDYLTILHRQSLRLKKLTEDLVEASKASTGNLTVNLVPTSIGELINQAVGEYSEKLEAGRLEAMVVLSQGERPVLADGKLLWRVLDNLLNNVCKYAMAGTRVYIEAKPKGEKMVISVKNISRDPLNVAAEELMERFVRGDSSRHTEGSGLGLNIAKSLVELQKGEFSLSIDGDLFKAEIVLNYVPSTE